MKIYQLHEYGGEWEDYHDYIIGTYLRKERAEEEKAKAEAKKKELIERSRKCNRCPFLVFPPLDLNDLLDRHSDYCTEAKLEEDAYGIECDNYYQYWDENRYDIREVEVEE